MERERLKKNFEQENSHDRKRKGAYLESIFENSAKKASPENAVSNNKERLLADDPNIKHSGSTVSESTSPRGLSMAKKPIGNGVNLENNSRTSSNHSSPEAASTKRGNSPNVNRGNHYTSFPTASTDANEGRAPTVGQKPGVFSNTSVAIKQEQPSELSLPVKIVSVRSQQHQERTESDESGETGDDYIKFLLCAGKLYRCERMSDLAHSYPRFGAEYQGRKVSGKVVVLLLFHKTFREVVNYVVGVIDHPTMEEQTIVIKIIKSHTYPTSFLSPKDVEIKTSKFAIGSKKLLYNLQPMQGPVYNELVKILDGFGANSTVDHSKINEFNAMINANAHKLDAQIASYLSTLSQTYVGTSSNRTSVGQPLGYPGSGVPITRYSPLANRQSLDSRYSPVTTHGGAFNNTIERSKVMDSRRIELENGYPKQTHASHRVLKDDYPISTVGSGIQKGRLSPKTYNTNAEQFRAASGISMPSNIRFQSTSDEASIVAQRRNVEDLQTVAELCKEKMKRDMAEQELKTIKAAFEEFKSRMQHHLSQVEERMVLLEAENRNLKGKLSNIHQSNGFAEKRYHDLRSRLEELLKSV